MNVTQQCADYPPQYERPANRPKKGLYYGATVPYTRTALFPHGGPKPKIKVVSDRAIKHVNELTQLQQAGKLEDGTPVECAVLFLVSRCVEPCAADRIRCCLCAVSWLLCC